MKRAEVTSGVLPLLFLLVISSLPVGCERSTEKTEASPKILYLSKVGDTPVLSIAEMRTNADFSATVLGVVIQDDPSSIQKHSALRGTTIVTNIYGVSLRDTNGHAVTMGGFNATEQEIAILRNLKEQHTYCFPKVFGQ